MNASDCNIEESSASIKIGKLKISVYHISMLSSSRVGHASVGASRDVYGFQKFDSIRCQLGRRKIGA
jgi:hypothetical protein